MRRFFLDSANPVFIEKVISAVGGDPKEYFAGITTNPKILQREGITNVDYFSTIKDLISLVNNLRDYDKMGRVYVQIPQSTMLEPEICPWVEKVKKEFDTIMLGLKLPPIPRIIQVVKLLFANLSLNITGVTEHKTAIEVAKEDVDYISFLFGRLEAEGINVENEIKLTLNEMRRGPRLLSGSLRDLSGLRRSFELNMVPTIGTSAWKSIEDNQQINEFINLLQDPAVPQKCIDMSKSFFNEMDEIGRELNLINL
jgi:hypothetical protein